MSMVLLSFGFNFHCAIMLISGPELTDVMAVREDFIACLLAFAVVATPAAASGHKFGSSGNSCPTAYELCRIGYAIPARYSYFHIVS